MQELKMQLKGNAFSKILINGMYSFKTQIKTHTHLVSKIYNFHMARSTMGHSVKIKWIDITEIEMGKNMELMFYNMLWPQTQMMQCNILNRAHRAQRSVSQCYGNAKKRKGITNPYAGALESLHMALLKGHVAK